MTSALPSTGRPLVVAVGPIDHVVCADPRAVTDAVHRAGCRPTTALEGADLFVGVFGPRPAEAAQRAYHLATARGIPRHIFLTPDGPECDHFRERLRSENVCVPFGSPDELRALITQALLDQRNSAPTATATDTDTEPTAVPQPPAFYTAPPYLLQGSKFVGRRAELAELDAWADSADRTMVVEAIGGMGKSALTWEWANRAAPLRMPSLAGRVWWSFYERGTSMKSFLRHALAYVTGRPPDAFLRIHATELGERLVDALRARPYLLVLDGFERVLAAYHRSDKAQLRDDRIPIDARECTNPRDGEVLRQLLRCAPSRVLVSTRLMPKALEDARTGRTLPGVQRIVLGGLAPADTIELAAAAGVRGDETGLIAFAEQFDRHPLLLRIACGLISDYGPAPGDFDAWAGDPAAGGALRLADLATGRRYTHLLEYAFRALAPRTRQLLSRVAVLSDASDYATVAVLNPFLPPAPAPAPEPPPLTGSWHWHQLLDRIANETDPAARAVLEAQRADAMAGYRDAVHAFERYQSARWAYPVSPGYRKGMAEFHAALTDLEDRGLLQWDRAANTYDLHPVVRAYAFDLLEEGERVRTFDAIGNHFASRPREDAQEATELSHLRNSIEIVRAYTGAGRGAEAAQFLRGKLSEALLFTVGAHHQLIELLQPLLGESPKGAHMVPSWRERSYCMNSLAIALSSVGRVAEAKGVYIDAAKLDLNGGDLLNLETGLRSLARCVQRGNELFLAEQLLDLAGALARATNDQVGTTAGLLDRLALAATLGRYDDAERAFATFRTCPNLPPHMYRPGAAEYHLALARFYRGRVTAEELVRGERIAADGRGVQNRHAFAALRAEFELSRGRPASALDAAEAALSVVQRTGEPATEYLGLRAHALARLDRAADAAEALAEATRVWDGLLPRFPFHAAEASAAQGDLTSAREFLVCAHRCAWADGPPYSHRYYLDRSAERMSQLGIPEPDLPAFRAEAAEPVPLGAELNRAIARYVSLR
jgi:tetratricopeptide (TPR) repeat protein